jgi:cytochrome P450
VQDYDPLSEDAKLNADAHYARLHERCPVHHYVLAEKDVKRIEASPLVANPTHEFWTVTRYQDCVQLLNDPHRYPSGQGPGPERMGVWTEGGMLIFGDPPAHIRQRRISAKAFTPKAVAAVESRIQAIADDLLDGLAMRGGAELLEEFTVQLSIRTIALILGVGADRVADFWRWGNGIVSAFGSDTEAAQEQFTAIMELFAFFQDRIDERRAMLAAGEKLPEDTLTGLIVAESDGTRFDDEEIKNACMQIVVAGFETTATGIANGIHLLDNHPEEKRKLQENPSLLPVAVEEIVRVASPLEGLFRTTVGATEIGGLPIPDDAKVRVMFAAANRDPQAFTDATRFRIDRDPAELKKHLGFGTGPHTCLGAALARAELRIGLGTLLHRLPDIHVDPDRTPVRSQVLIINGFAKLWVRWDPAKAVPREARA